MFSDEEKKIFIRHSLDNKDNLKLSINAALSFDAIREKIISDFIDSLEAKLKDKYSGDWEIENKIKDNVFDRYKGVCLWKPQWNKEYRVSLSSEKFGARGFIYGISKIDEGVLHIPNLFEKMNKMRGGRQSSSWNWWQWVDRPYQDWDNEKSLLGMYSGEALPIFVEYFSSVIDASEEFIDSYLRNR